MFGYGRCQSNVLDTSYGNFMETFHALCILAHVVATTCCMIKV